VTYSVRDQRAVLAEVWLAACEAGMRVEAEAICRREVDEREAGSNRVVARARTIRRLRRLVRDAYGMEVLG
jgi:hypothetical protein